MSPQEQKLHTFDESELPEWSIHESDQEELSAFFNNDEDRSGANAIFSIPRGQSDMADNVFVVNGAVPEEDIQASGQPQEQNQDQNQDEATQPAEGALVEEQAAEEQAAEEQAAEEQVAEDQFGHDHSGQDHSEDKQPSEADTASSAEKAEKEDNKLPRREDFARFRCIYESRDGQLALYEDEEGHLTAVNTNRFV